MHLDESSELKDQALAKNNHFSSSNYSESALLSFWMLESTLHFSYNLQYWITFAIALTSKLWILSYPPRSFPFKHFVGHFYISSNTVFSSILLFTFEKFIVYKLILYFWEIHCIPSSTYRATCQYTLYLMHMDTIIMIYDVLVIYILFLCFLNSILC